MQTLTREFFDENFKKDNKIYNWLNNDNLSDIIIDGSVFWIELTCYSATLPNYVFDFIEKWCNKKGYVYFQDGEIIQYLNNNKLGKAKATTLYHAVKSIITKLRKDASEGKTPKFEDNKILFIKNILNYQKFDKDKDPKNNQIWFNVEESSVRIGNKSYSFSEIDKLESEIVNQLSDVYHSANSKTIKKKSSEKFYEYYFENGKLEEREWVNYQSYLASGKDSTGKNVRPVDEIPFVTINSPTATTYSTKTISLNVTATDTNLDELLINGDAIKDSTAGDSGNTIIADDYDLGSAAITISIE
jgi:hypothetical protein